MAIIHATTMNPAKLDLLAAWLPRQPWYGGGPEPRLTKAGGFRLDDPAGEVGIEFMVVTDSAGERAATYQVPLTYRAAALAPASDALIGTAEHGVLGQRWIYDGTHDPVLAAQLVALIQGDAEPQAQSVSNTPDPTVTSHPVTDGTLTAAGAVAVAHGSSATDLQVETADRGGLRAGRLIVRIHRILVPGDGAAGAGGPGQPCVSATWGLADGARVRGVFATARYLPAQG
jgi:hypothetical protein